jgi:hypothetical protein
MIDIILSMWYKIFGHLISESKQLATSVQIERYVFGNSLVENI